MDRELGEEGFGLLIADSRMNDDIFTLLPVDRRRDAVLVAWRERRWREGVSRSVMVTGGLVRTHQSGASQ